MFSVAPTEVDGFEAPEVFPASTRTSAVNSLVSGVLWIRRNVPATAPGTVQRALRTAKAPPLVQCRPAAD